MFTGWIKVLSWQGAVGGYADVGAHVFLCSVWAGMGDAVKSTPIGSKGEDSSLARCAWALGPRGTLCLTWCISSNRKRFSCPWGTADTPHGQQKHIHRQKSPFTLSPRAKQNKTPNRQTEQKQHPQPYRKPHWRKKSGSCICMNA